MTFLLFIPSNTVKTNRFEPQTKRIFIDKESILSSPTVKLFSISKILSYTTKLSIMKAKFKTTCVSCNGEINPGKEIAKDPSGKWVHKHCLTEENDLP